MRLGITAYPTPTGLGYQTKSYYKHLNPTKVMEIDLTGYNGMQKHDWFPNAQKVVGYPKHHDMVEFLRDLDVVLFAETPLNYDFYTIARDMGVKTATVINWEFFDHIAKPELPLPDLFIMPSVWHLEDMQTFGHQNGVPVVQIHHPVDLDELPFRERQTTTFMHIAGNPAVNDRNGTELFLQACPDGTVTTQNNDLAVTYSRLYRHCTMHLGIEDQKVLYQLADIMVLPRKYGGNCLPMNEALASGMPVIMPDISPNNHLLPKEWLVPATLVDRFEPRTVIDIYEVNPSDLFAKLEWFRGANIQQQSRLAYEIAQNISWENLKSKYEEALQTL